MEEKAPQIRIRLFLLSGSQLLNEMFANVLKKTADILVVGASPHSLDAPAKIIESKCHVLLADSVSMRTLDCHIHDRLRNSLSQLKVVVIVLDDNDSTFSKLARSNVMGYVMKEAAIADVISAIRFMAKLEVVTAPRLHMAHRASAG